jgi:class 3 adenylate cyclase
LYVQIALFLYSFPRKKHFFDFSRLTNQPPSLRVNWNYLDSVTIIIHSITLFIFTDEDFFLLRPFLNIPARETMKCRKCQFENPAGMKFCGECGTTLQFTGIVSETRSEETKTRLTPEPERKHVTALFSDLTGYTAMTEKLDPEQVKEITGRIFSGVKQIVSKYEGFIERVMGDGVLAFFGVPRSHEDDPTRAVRAAMEIHALVKAMSPEYEAMVGAPLTMHSGINTGLVVTADVDPTRGTQGIAGDAVNVASRLSGLAGPGEILVGEETVRSAKRHVVFDDLGPKRVKGKAEPITVYKVISIKASPQTIGADRQVSSEMVGRDK